MSIESIQLATYGSAQSPADTVPPEKSIIFKEKNGAEEKFIRSV